MMINLLSASFYHGLKKMLSLSTHCRTIKILPTKMIIAQKQVYGYDDINRQLKYLRFVLF